MMIIVIGVVLVFFLLAFLGYVQSHWIAPAFLFVVPVPLIITTLWNEPYTNLFGALFGTLIFLYVAFALGRLVGGTSKRSPDQKIGYRVRHF